MIRNVPPMDPSTISKKARAIRDNRPDPGEVYEEVEDLSRPELRATVEMTRDELALQWASVKQLGEKLQEQFEDFKDWISERLRDTYRNDPKGAKHPFSDLLLGYARMGLPVRRDQWTHVKAHSHLGSDRRMLDRQIGMFNRIAGRYEYLRGERMSVALGGSEPTLEEYEPSGAAEVALSAVIQAEEDLDGLAEMDIGDVWDHVEEEMELVNARANVYQDMKGRNKAPEHYPQSTEKLLEVAREFAGKRSQTFADELNP